MKKLVPIIAILIAILSLNKYEMEIPKEAIRFRIIANSNSDIDQNLKKHIVNNISNELLLKSNNINDARKYLKTNIPTFEEKIKETLREENKDTNFTINYGENYFPEKEEHGITYKEGFYESLVITLGEGKGDNFWCILFPPICMIDTDNDVEYKSFIKEVLNRYK